MTAILEGLAHTPTGLLSVLEMEISGKCQERCIHCLSSSSPQGTHGTMTLAEWQTIITDAAALEIPKIQLIGGEPTLYPHWVELTRTSPKPCDGASRYASAWLTCCLASGLGKAARNSSRWGSNRSTSIVCALWGEGRSLARRPVSTNCVGVAGGDARRYSLTGNSRCAYCHGSCRAATSRSSRLRRFSTDPSGVRPSSESR